MYLMSGAAILTWCGMYFKPDTKYQNLTLVLNHGEENKHKRKLILEVNFVNLNKNVMIELIFNGFVVFFGLCCCFGSRWIGSVSRVVCGACFGTKLGFDILKLMNIPNLEKISLGVGAIFGLLSYPQLSGEVLSVFSGGYLFGSLSFRTDLMMQCSVAATVAVAIVTTWGILNQIMNLCIGFTGGAMILYGLKLLEVHDVLKNEPNESYLGLISCIGFAILTALICKK